MKKNIFLLFCSVFIFNSAFVYGKDTVSPSSNFVTYRVGASIAGEYTSIDGHLKNRPASSVDDGNLARENFASDAHHICRKAQISPGFEFGTFIAQHYYLGFVLSHHFTNASNPMKTSIGNSFHFEHQLKLKSYTSLFLKFGFKMMPNVMFYGLVGPSFANWSHNSKTIYLDSTNGAKKVLASSEMNKKTIGFGIGGGIEYLKNEKYAINMDYTLNMHKAEGSGYHSSYNKPIEDPVWDVIVFKTLPANVQKSVRLSYSTIGLRFSYFFSF
jgi:hypothetical protein